MSVYHLEPIEGFFRRVEAPLKTVKDPERDFSDR